MGTLKGPDCVWVRGYEDVWMSRRSPGPVRNPTPTALGPSPTPTSTVQSETECTAGPTWSVRSFVQRDPHDPKLNHNRIMRPDNRTARYTPRSRLYSATPSTSCSRCSHLFFYLFLPFFPSLFNVLYYFPSWCSLLFFVSFAFIFFDPLVLWSKVALSYRPAFTYVKLWHLMVTLVFFFV